MTVVKGPWPDRRPPEPEKPPCAWCSEPSVTNVTVEKRPGKLPRTAPACELHAKSLQAGA